MMRTYTHGVSHPVVASSMTLANPLTHLAHGFVGARGFEHLES